MIPMEVTPTFGLVIEMFTTLIIVPALNLVLLETRAKLVAANHRVAR
mgnify:CR=1 FL=1|jgi:hypothetical protein